MKVWGLRLFSLATYCLCAQSTCVRILTEEKEDIGQGKKSRWKANLILFLHENCSFSKLKMIALSHGSTVSILNYYIEIVPQQCVALM